MLGGGTNNFLPSKFKDNHGNPGRRKDGANLIQEWLEGKKSLAKSPIFVQDRKQLLEIDEKKHKSVLGLFSTDHLPYHLDASEDYPTLAEMTIKAIKMLSSNDNGFFLFVEGEMGSVICIPSFVREMDGLEPFAELTVLHLYRLVTR